MISYLFRMADEHQHYAAGDKRHRAVARLAHPAADLLLIRASRCGRATAMIRFGAVCSELARAAPAATLANILTARAIENQAYVAGCNRAGN